MDFSKLFLMDLYLREQYKSRHASITCIQFVRLYPPVKVKKHFPDKFDRCETAKRKNT